VNLAIRHMSFRFEHAGLTDTGLQRTHNEDSILMMPDQGLFVICDGMGGHASGAVASSLAVKTIANAFLAGQFTPPEEPLVTAILAANAAVHQRSVSDPQCHNMGTTVVAVRLEGDNVHLCHVGDSRIYRLRGEELSQITRDHSLINLYADRPEYVGKLGPAHSNIIVRAVGLHENVDVEHTVMPLESGDLLLLCSDGLIDMVDDWMVREMVTSGDEIETLVANLVRAANANGGSDNVSVILVRAQPEG
jgi:protein phosphatase